MTQEFLTNRQAKHRYTKNYSELLFFTNYTVLCYQCFMTDLKRLYYLTGVENKPTVFLFNDTQALEESFLEDISNILSSGEVPNLYKPEEFEEVCGKLMENRCSSVFFYFISKSLNAIKF